MNSGWGFVLFPAAVPALVLTLSVAGYAGPERAARSMIVQPIEAGKVVALAGNIRPEANAQNDRGKVADNYPLDHMLLQLKRPPGLEQALEAFLAELSTPGSPNYHKWLTAVEFGQRFGLSQADLDTITRWL
ncbi:MAG: protease pro-enzyme activation domain-containing protein, partial [Bryobacteraceae bacterium]